MLTEWIEMIKTQKRYRPELWRCTGAGSVVELSVEPSFGRFREEYRISVIHIGMALQAIVSSARKEGVPHHIQSFPNLENSQIVAVLRLSDSIRKGVSPTEPHSEDLSGKVSAMQIMKKTANQLNLAMDYPADITNSSTSEPPDRIRLLSQTDNPFTWLKTGYWIEIVANQLTSGSDDFQPDLLNSIKSRMKGRQDTYQFTQLHIPYVKEKQKSRKSSAEA